MTTTEQRMFDKLVAVRDRVVKPWLRGEQTDMDTCKRAVASMIESLSGEWDDYHPDIQMIRSQCLELAELAIEVVTERARMSEPDTLLGE